MTYKFYADQFDEISVLDFISSKTEQSTDNVQISFLNIWSI
jgi:hypothetical protein